MCHEKKIAIAYHRLCQDCAQLTCQCAKCQQLPQIPKEGEPRPDDEDILDDDELSASGDEGSRGSDDERPAAPVEPSPGHGGGAKRGIDTRFDYVNVEDEDIEELKRLVGLDVRCLKSRMIAQRRSELKGEIKQLRERDRRTALRNLKKRAEQGSSDEDGDKVQSDEEVL